MIKTEAAYKKAACEIENGLIENWKQVSTMFVFVSSAQASETITQRLRPRRFHSIVKRVPTVKSLYIFVKNFQTRIQVLLAIWGWK